MEERDEDERQVGVRFPEQVDVVVMDREQSVLISRIQRYSHALRKRNHPVAEPSVVNGVVQFFTIRQILDGFLCKIVQPAEYLADHIRVAHNHVVAVEDVSRGKVEAKEITLASSQR